MRNDGSGTAGRMRFHKHRVRSGYIRSGSSYFTGSGGSHIRSGSSHIRSSGSYIRSGSSIRIHDQGRVRTGRT
jgi:hypothetical protein